MTRLLVTHGWLRGNLGDACITRRLLLFLRDAFPDARIDLIAAEDAGWPGAREIAALADRFAVAAPRRRFARWFAGYDAVINAPGGGLQDPGDARASFLLRDARACGMLGVRHAFASHSFHPSIAGDVPRESLVIAREPESAAALRRRGLSPVDAADLAFLEPLPERAAAPGGTLLFLRHDHVRAFERERGGLRLDGRFVPLPDDALTLASSDRRRDDDLLGTLSRRWRVPYAPSDDLPHLLGLIAGAAHVASDRYHPVVFAAMLGVPWTLIPREGSPRDRGLARLLREHAPAELGERARNGLQALRGYIASAPQRMASNSAAGWITA